MGATMRQPNRTTRAGSAAVSTLPSRRPTRWDDVEAERRRLDGVRESTACSYAHDRSRLERRSGVLQSVGRLYAGAAAVRDLLCELRERRRAGDAERDRERVRALLVSDCATSD